MQKRLHFFGYAVLRGAQPRRTPGGVKKGATNKISNKTQERAKTIFTGADLYVFRYVYGTNNDGEDSSWELRNSKPCAHCTQLIKMAGIRYVYYSDVVDVGIKEKKDGLPGVPRIVKIKAKNLFNDHLTYGRRRAAAKLTKEQNL